MNLTPNEKLARIELERRLKESNSAALMQFEVDSPHLAKLVSSQSNHLVHKKHPKGRSKVIPDIVKLMTDPDNIEKTQIKLIEDVSKLHPEQYITKSIWSNDLQSYQVKAIKEQLKQCGLPESLAKGCKKLSHVRKKLKDHLYAEIGKTKEFNTTISINNKLVTIGKKSYSVVWKESKGNRYPCIRVTVKSKRCSIRVDALATALLAGEIG